MFLKKAAQSNRSSSTHKEIDKTYPVGATDKEIRQSRNHWARRPSNLRCSPTIEKFPVLFPVSKEFGCRDSFNYDRVGDQYFQQVSTVDANARS